MQTRHLIDRIVQQTTVLIAQLSTAAGIRAPLSHVADQVFYELSREIEAQGVGRKVAADMFGLALRTYQKKVNRLSESVSVRDRTLWEAVLDYLRDEGSTTRERIAERFSRDEESDTAAVLNDLVSSGLVYSTGRGRTAVFGVTSKADQLMLAEQPGEDGLAHLVWLTVYRRRMLGLEDLVANVRAPEAEVRTAVEQLVGEGRLLRQQVDGAQVLTARRLLIPVGSEEGWEAAVLDHFQAVATAIGAKVSLGRPRSAQRDVVGGATLRFEVHHGHPFEERVYGLLERVRADVNALWNEVSEYNREHTVPEEDRARVCFYFGQNVEDGSDRADAMEVGS